MFVPFGTRSICALLDPTARTKSSDTVTAAFSRSDESVRVVPREQGERPGVPKRAAEHAPDVEHPVKERGRPREDRAVQRVEVFPQRDVNRIEGGRIVLRARCRYRRTR